MDLRAVCKGRLSPLFKLSEGFSRNRLNRLTPPASQARLSLVFTPRWISRKASSGVLFFRGGNRAS